MKVAGRGGTMFTPVIEYINKDKYFRDALLLYFTDGFGPHPNFDGRNDINILWIFTSKYNYDKGIKWTSKISNNNATYIPLPY